MSARPTISQGGKSGSVDEPDWGGGLMGVDIKRMVDFTRSTSGTYGLTQRLAGNLPHRKLGVIG